MNTLAEHLLDPNLPLTAAEGNLPLHIQHEKRAFTIAAAVFSIRDGQPQVIVNTMLRPEQFAAIQAEVAEFNADTELGWARLGMESARNIDAEADELLKQVEALRKQSLDLGFAFSDRI